VKEVNVCFVKAASIITGLTSFGAPVEFLRHRDRHVHMFGCAVDILVTVAKLSFTAVRFTMPVRLLARKYIKLSITHVFFHILVVHLLMKMVKLSGSSIVAFTYFLRRLAPGHHINHDHGAFFLVSSDSIIIIVIIIISYYHNYQLNTTRTSRDSSTTTLTSGSIPHILLEAACPTGRSIELCELSAVLYGPMRSQILTGVLLKGRCTIRSSITAALDIYWQYSVL
jgi:hypothetical protein